MDNTDGMGGGTAYQGGFSFFFMTASLMILMDVFSYNPLSFRS